VSGRDSGEGGLDPRQGLPLRAVKPISRSLGAGYRADFGPSRGDLCRPASRTTEAFKIVVCYVRSRSTRGARPYTPASACDSKRPSPWLRSKQYLHEASTSADGRQSIEIAANSDSITGGADRQGGEQLRILWVYSEHRPATVIDYGIAGLGEIASRHIRAVQEVIV
jgi:hypothetical protein